MTQSRVRNIAEHYVSQRECSEQMLRDVLLRRLDGRARAIGAEKALAERDEAIEIIEAEITRLVKSGLIDNARFAEMKIRSGLEAGKAKRRLAMDLSRKGIDQSVFDLAFQEAVRETTGVYDAEADMDVLGRSAEWLAAEGLARKRRIGPWRTKPLPEDRTERMKAWRREAGVMARAGFGFDLIKQILDLEIDDVETP